MNEDDDEIKMKVNTMEPMLDETKLNEVVEIVQPERKGINFYQSFL